MSYKATGWKLGGAARLGEFIHEQHPYPWQMELPVNLENPSNYEDVEKEGPGKHRDQTNPFTVVDVTGDRERFMEGLFWHFGGKPPDEQGHPDRVHVQGRRQQGVQAAPAHRVRGRRGRDVAARSVVRRTGGFGARVTASPRVRRWCDPGVVLARRRRLRSPRRGIAGAADASTAGTQTRRPGDSRGRARRGSRPRTREDRASWRAIMGRGAPGAQARVEALEQEVEDLEGPAPSARSGGLEIRCR